MPQLPFSGSATPSSPDRRRFLTGAAASALAPLALGAAAGTSPAPAPAIAPPEGRRCGVSIMMWTYGSPFSPLPGLEPVSKLGVDAVELTRTLTAKNNAEVAAKCKELGLKVHNIDAGTSLFGSKNALTNPAERDSILAGMRKAVENARLYETDTLLVLSGVEIEGLSRDEMRRSVVEGLKAMAEIADGEGLNLILEPLNRFDHPGSFLGKMDESFAILREVDSPRLKILYDIYHVQMEEGNVIAKIRDNIDLIGHFHVADVPGRHQPGTGELNYPNIFDAIAETPYTGHIGLEFKPQGDADPAIAAARELILNHLG